jgi:uncharacterized protein
MPTFPGVYPSVIDNSFYNGFSSRFTCGLVGVAARGPFNAATRVRSLSDFVSSFGPALSGSYLAQAVAAITADSDGAQVVRVGRQYTSQTTAATGATGAYTLFCATTDISPGNYLRVSQAGKATTANALVQSASAGTVTLVSSGVAPVSLAATYTSATVDRATVANAANKAEGFLAAPTYSSALVSAGTVNGNKSAFQFTVSGTPSALTVGDVIKIEQSGKATTREAQVSAVSDSGAITLIPSTTTETGQQAVALQDSYTSGVIYKVASISGTANGAQIQAATEGTWANQIGTNGVSVQVSPGSNADTKKFMVYYNGQLVETYDNLIFDDTTDDNYVVTRLAASAYINVTTLVGAEPPSNTKVPWNSIYTGVNNVYLTGGFNGDTTTAADYVGIIDPAAGSPTGIKVFDDPENIDVAALAAPGISDIAVAQELARVATNINSVVLFDIPDNINARDAIDWHNGAGAYAANGRIDNFRVAFFFNWFQALDTFSGVQMYMPPTVGILGAMARTFDKYKPWSAVAGVTRGQLPSASSVRYSRISDSVKQAMYGDGNSVNPILFYRSQSILIYGDRTAQRTESKLTALHTVNLVNYIVKNLSTIGRRYVFDPNDSVLLDQLRLEFNSFMDAIKAERGVEAFQVVLDSTNNTAATRNERRVNCNLVIIPTDVMERLYLNVIVNESGAVLNSVSGS